MLYDYDDVCPSCGTILGIGVNSYCDDPNGCAQVYEEMGNEDENSNDENSDEEGEIEDEECAELDFGD